MKRNLFGLQAVVVAGLLLVAGPGVAQTVTWDGSGDTTWGPPPDATSWSGGTYNNGNTAVFAGAGQGVVTVDAGGVSPGAITITSGDYTFTGGSIGGGGTLSKGGGGTVVLAAANSFSGGVSISGGNLESQIDGALGSGTVTLSGSGNLLFSTTDQQIDNPIVPGNRQLNVADGRTATLSGTITSSGTVDINFGGTGTLTLSGDNSATISGSTLVRNGTLGLGSDTALGTSTLNLQANAALLPVGGARTLGNNWSLNSPGPNYFPAGYDLTLTGSGSVNGGNNEFYVENITTLAGNISGANSLRRRGTGTLILSGNNSGWTGGLRIESTGTYVAGSDTAFGSLLDMATADAVLRAANGNRTLSGAVRLHDFTYDGTTGLNLTFNGTNQLFNGSRTVTVNGSGVLTIDSLGQNAANYGLTKAGAGTMVLTGTGTYSGNTTASAGLLLTPQAAALPGYTTSNKIRFSGGTIGVQVGGSGWTTGQVDTLLANATKTSGALGIDTSNGNLTQWTAFTTTNFGPALGLTKLGSNTLTLDQANSYQGATTVSAGTLLVDGSHIGGGLYTVAAGATLGGSGTIGAGVNVAAGGVLTGRVTVTGNTVVQGTHRPGDSPGIQSVGNYILDGGTLEIEIEGPTAGNGAGYHDQVNVTGAVSLINDPVLSIAGVSGISVMDVLTILSNDGTDPVVGTFFGLPEGTAFLSFGQKLVISYVGGSGNDITLTRIPEPTAGLLLALGGLALLKRTRKP